MRKLLAFLLLLTPLAWASTTVTGNVRDLGSGKVKGVVVRFYLRGCGGNQPRVQWVGTLAPSVGAVWYQDLVSDANGDISGTLYSTRDVTGNGDGDIECGGSRLAVWYGMVLIKDGKAGPETPVHAKNSATIDLSNITPIMVTPVVPAPAGDTTYFRLDGGNSPPSMKFLGILPKVQDSIRFASQYPGSDCGAKINAADADLGASHGEIWVSQACGTTISTAVNLSANHNLKFIQGGTYVQSARIAIGFNGELAGLASNYGWASTILQASANFASSCPADSAGVSYMAQVCMGANASIHHILIDGNKASQSGSVQAVLVQNVHDIKIHDATIQNASQDNVHVTSTFYPTVTAGQTLALNSIVFLYANDANKTPMLYKVTTGGTGAGTYPSCAPTGTCTWGTVTFTKERAPYDNAAANGWIGPNVLLVSAGRDNMFAERQQDWTIGANVQFEVAGRDGFHCEDCSVFRFGLGDFGANTRYGFYAASVNGMCGATLPAVGHIIASGTQFAGNGSGDIYVNGSAGSDPWGFCSAPRTFQTTGGNTIVGNQFGGAFADGIHSIQFVDAGGNLVAGNTFGSSPLGAAYGSLGISSFSTLTGTARQPNIFTRNAIQKLYNRPAYTAGTPYSLTTGVDVADGVTTQGAETVWGNTVLNGTLTVNQPAGQYLTIAPGSGAAYALNVTNSGGGTNYLTVSGAGATNTKANQIDDGNGNMSVTGLIYLSNGLYNGTGQLVIPSTANGYLGSGTKVAIGQTCTTGNIGGAALTVGQTVTGTCTLATAATGHTGVAVASDGSAVQAGFVINPVTVNGTTATVNITCVAAGTPASKTYNITVF